MLPERQRNCCPVIIVIHYICLIQKKLNKTDSKKNYQSLINKNFEDQYLMTAQLFVAF